MSLNPRGVEFELPFATESLNAAMRSHWRTKRNKAKKMKRLVYYLTHEQAPVEPFQRAQIHIIRHSSGRLDHDNMVGGCKSLIDALQVAGIITDDTPDHVSITYDQQRAPRGTSKTEVMIMEFIGL